MCEPDSHENESPVDQAPDAPVETPKRVREQIFKASEWDTYVQDHLQWMDLLGELRQAEHAAAGEATFAAGIEKRFFSSTGSLFKGAFDIVSAHGAANILLGKQMAHIKALEIKELLLKDEIEARALASVDNNPPGKTQGEREEWLARAVRSDPSWQQIKSDQVYAIASLEIARANSQQDYQMVQILRAAINQIPYLVTGDKDALLSERFAQREAPYPTSSEGEPAP